MPFPTSTQIYLLKLLLKRPKSYAFQLVKYSEGKIKAGSIYVVLGRMLDDGLIQAEVIEDSEQKQAGHPRPKYTVTAKGEKTLKEWAR